MFGKNSESNIVGLIELYRFISIFLTLSIYIISGVYEHFAFITMFLLAFCVAASAFLLGYLYNISYWIKPRLHFLILLEIFGLSFLIFLTDGLNSPFIWCFLNPLLIISRYTLPRHKVIYLVSNLVLLCGIGYYIERTSGVGEYFLSHSNFLLSYILILILVNILLDYNSRITKKQEELRVAYEKLEGSNARIKGMIQDILSMYEAVQAIPSQRDKQEIVHIILDFAGRISPESNPFFVLSEGASGTGDLSFLKTVGVGVRDELADKILNGGLDISENSTTVHVLENGNRALFIKVSDIRNYGVIGLLVSQPEYVLNKNDYDTCLLLYSQFGATFFEKIESEAVSRELAVADEQNRIADDIHDIVIQRLFATSCFTYDTIKKWNRISDKDKKEQMTLIMETLQSSLKDLRSTIYNLSNKKQQIDLFAESISAYLSDIERLSGIRINMEIDGDPDNFLLGARKALYRIITECTGNAVRHAKCKNVWINLNVKDVQTFLTIRDDGIGFDLQQTEHVRGGLGLYNIRSLVRIFNGTVDINTDIGSGTAVVITFANADIMKKLDGDWPENCRE